jgi:hypothetical protein
MAPVCNMSFDWELLRPNQELSDAHKSLTQEIAENFLVKGGGIPSHQKRVQLGKGRNLLNDLVQLGIIRNNGNHYYPTFLAFYYLSPQLRDNYAAVLHLLLSAIKDLYESGPDQYTTQRVEESVNAFLRIRASLELGRMLRGGDVYLRRAMLFLQDFTRLVSVRESNNPEAPIVAVAATDNILDYENLDQAWRDELAVRPSTPTISSLPPPKKRIDLGELKPDLNNVAVSQSTESAKEGAGTAAEIQQTTPASSPETQRSQQPEEGTGESIDTSSISDTPTSKDSLGFKPYVEAISKFLLSPDTKPPLTLSIEGEWGSGKSSFMLQLGDTLKKESLNQRIQSFSVHFNPWRHDKEDSLWAAFALEFLRQMMGQRFLLPRWRGDLRLFWAHYSWKSGWYEMLRAVAVWLALGVLVIGSIEVVRHKPRWAEEMVVALSNRLNSPQAKTSPPKNGELPNATEGRPPQGEKGKQEEKGEANFDPILRVLLLVGGNAAYFAVVLTIWLKLKDVVGNPLEINLKKYLRSPDYEGRVAFVEQFHADFKKIVDAYAGKEKVFVFIDDLDRCEVPKAAELMKAVNLLIADDPRLIFILGMDRDKVAAGLAVKYEKILPYLSPESQATSNESQAKWRAGLDFGQNFLQKFIQLPFRVPEPNPEQYEDFIRTISVPPDTKAATEAAQRSPATVKLPSPNEGIAETKRATVIASTPAPDPRSVAELQVRRERELQFGGDSDKVRAVASMFAKTLGRNPRRLKQFFNLFRLQAYIANEIGLFDPGGKGRPSLTLEQLGKFVAISLRWPALLAQFAEDSKLLERLEGFAIEKPLPDRSLTERESRWLTEPQLLALLRFGTEQGTEGFLLSDYTVFSPTIRKLLHICPQRVRLPQPGDGA